MMKKACMSHRLVLIILAYLYAGMVVLYAQQDEKELNGILDELVVTGTGTQHFSQVAPIRTELITEKDLESYAPEYFLDLLMGLSSSFDASHSSMGTGLTLGGLGNKYILVLVNGRRLHGDVGGQSDLSKIDPTTIKKVEIVKGAASTLYGSDAIAGVINVITKDPTDHRFKVENTTRYGSYNTWRQSNVITFSLGDWSSVTKYSGMKSDGWQNSTQELYRDKLYENSTTPTVSPYYNHSLTQEFTWKPDARWSLYANGMIYKKKIFHYAGEPRLRQYHLRYNDQAIGLGGEYKASPDRFYTLDLNFDRHAYYYDYHIRYMDERIREEILSDGRKHYIPDPFFYYPGESSLESDQRRFLAHGKGVFNLSDEHTLSGGLEAVLDQLRAPRRMVKPTRSAASLSMYAQDEWQMSPIWNVTAGLRYIYHQAFGSQLTPKVSFHYANERGLHLRGSYAMGYKTPTIKELYYEYERTMMGKLRVYLGNPDLRPETSQFISFGGSYSPISSLTLNLNGSFNRLKDMIVLVPTELPDKYLSDEGSEFDTGMKYINGEKATIKELEASISWRPSKHWRLSAGYSLTDAWADIFDEKQTRKQEKIVIDHRQIDGTSRHKGNFGATWMYKKKGYDLTVGLHGRMQSDRYYKYYGDAPGYMLWNLSSTHKFKISKTLKAQLAIGIENLLDYKETHPYGYNFGTKTAGRTFFASINIGFEQKKM